MTTGDGSKYLAVYMGSLWDTFEARFKPNYGQSLIAQLAEDSGVHKNDKRYFVALRENSLAYPKALKVTVPVQPDSGIWEEEDEPWTDSALDNARKTIQIEPTTADDFRRSIPPIAMA